MEAKRGRCLILVVVILLPRGGGEGGGQTHRRAAMCQVHWVAPRWDLTQSSAREVRSLYPLHR